MARREYIENPTLVQIREGFSLLDLKRYVEAHGFKGEGLGQLDFNDLIENAPIMVPVNALGYNHFVIFRGVMRDRVLLADPAWGNRTMTTDKFQRMWLDYGKEMGHVGFIVKGGDGSAPKSRLGPKSIDFVMFD
jgi:predicted double-glycine peptidase